MLDIIVTTPLAQSAAAAKEAEHILAEGGGNYFRRLAVKPTHLQVGDRVFYQDRGFIRGFALASEIAHYAEPRQCDTTHRMWPAGTYITMDATTWTWIVPIPMGSFRGFQYAHFVKPFEIVGGWRDPMPDPVQFGFASDGKEIALA